LLKTCSARRFANFKFNTVNGPDSFTPPDTDCDACKTHWRGFKHVETKISPLIDRLTHTGGASKSRSKQSIASVWKAESTEGDDIGMQYDICPCCNGFCRCDPSPSIIANCTCKQPATEYDDNCILVDERHGRNVVSSLYVLAWCVLFYILACCAFPHHQSAVARRVKGSKQKLLEKLGKVGKHFSEAQQHINLGHKNLKQLEAMIRNMKTLPALQFENQEEEEEGGEDDVADADDECDEEEDEEEQGSGLDSGKQEYRNLLAAYQSQNFPVESCYKTVPKGRLQLKANIEALRAGYNAMTRLVRHDDEGKARKKPKPNSSN
jgi:hypothetical protein